MSVNDTPCKNCCFALYEDITQVGCARNRIEKYQSTGVEIVEAYDEEKEFFVIKNRLCPFYRDQKWLDAFSGRPDSDIEKILKFETMSSFHLIILLQKDSEFKDLEETVRSVEFEFENVPPSQVTIVRPRGLSQIKAKDIKDLFNGIPVRWRIENLLVDKTDSQIIHSVQKTIKSQYYCVCKAGYKLPVNYFRTVHKAVIDNLLQFGMVEVEEGDLNGIIIPLHVHEYWYFHGHIEKTIPENIKEYQCQNQDQQIVFQLKQVKNFILQSA